MHQAPFRPVIGPQKIAADFYAGMVTTARDLENTAIPAMLAAFAKRELETSAELAFQHKHIIHKFTQDLNQLSTARVLVPRLKIELFCMIAALNLYEAKAVQEDFAAAALEKEFFKEAAKHEDNWLQLNNAQIIDFHEQTGHERNQWRAKLIQGYLENLCKKSSRDSAALIATKRFLARQGLAKEAGVNVSPALLEACASQLGHASRWLVNYLKKNTN